MRFFRSSQLPAVRWRNDGGWTREIGSGRVALSDIKAQGTWDWRVSVASITEDGEFSTFAGIDRLAGLVDGKIALESPCGELSWNAPGDIGAFAGETLFTASLQADTARFLNVMTRRDCATARMLVHRSDFSFGNSACAVSCLLTLAGSFQVSCTEGVMYLHADEGALLDAPASPKQVKMLSASGCIFEVQVHDAKSCTPMIPA